MAHLADISESVKNFIFQFLDSIELLDVLLTLNFDRQKAWSIQAISEHLRSNPTSIKRRIDLLLDLKLIDKNLETPHTYFYNPKDPENQEIIEEIARIYQIQRHRLFELIFSPLKGARDFADAFRISKAKIKREDQDD